MARLKRHHLRNHPPVSSNDEISDSDRNDAEPHFPARSMSDSDIEGTPPSPSISGFIIEPFRSAFAGEDSAVRPKRSSARSGSKRLSERDGGEVKKKEKKKSSSAVGGGGDEEIKKSSGAVQRIWSEEDEIAILKGVIEYRAKTGSDPSSDAGGFLDFIKDTIHVEASKAQLMDKIRKLKKKFRVNSEKGEHPVFTRSHDSTAFELSKKIWGIAESNEETMIHNNATVSGKRVVKLGRSEEKTPLGLVKQEDANAKKKKKLANLESENRVEAAKKPRVDFEDLADAAVAAAAAEVKWNPEVADDRIEEVVKKGCDGKANGGRGEEAKSVDDRIEMVVDENGGRGDADAFWARYPYLRDALEMMVSQGMMGDFQKRLVLEKVRDKVKEWDDMWKALRFEEMQLHIKRYNLFAEFSQAAFDELNK